MTNTVCVGIVDLAVIVRSLIVSAFWSLNQIQEADQDAPRYFRLLYAYGLDADNISRTFAREYADAVARRCLREFDFEARLQMAVEELTDPEDGYWDQELADFAALLLDGWRAEAQKFIPNHIAVYKKADELELATLSHVHDILHK